MPDVFQEWLQMGKTGKYNGERRSLEKSPDHSCLTTFHFQRESCRASWEICLWVWVSAAIARSPTSQCSPWRLPVRTVTLCSSHNSDARVEWVWNKPSSDFFSVSIENRVWVKEITYRLSFSGVSLTHYKEHDPDSCEDAEHQAPNQPADQRGLFCLSKADSK